MKKKWVQKGFGDFIGGTYGNGGQNLYVSKKGRLHCRGYSDMTSIKTDMLM